MRAPVGTAIACGMALLISSSVGQAQKKLGFGLYVPESPADSGERFAFAKSMAQHLSKHLGVPVEGSAYKSARDLEWDVRARKIHFAVLGAFYLAGKSKIRVLAQGKARSAAETSWTIMCKQKSKLADLKGQVLQIPSLGAITLPFIQHGLLDGLPLKETFKIVRSPTLPSAVIAVQLGKASATLAPMTTKGLKPLFGGITVAQPGFTVLDRRLPASLVQKATEAILSYRGSLASISGWGPVNASSYRALVASARKKVHKMVLAGIRNLPLPHRGMVAIDSLGLQLPNLRETFLIP